LGLLWEGKITVLDFSFSNFNDGTNMDPRRFFKEIEE